MHKGKLTVLHFRNEGNYERMLRACYIIFGVEMLPRYAADKATDDLSE